MAAPPVPSNSNNWPKGWILRSRSLHNCALIFDTYSPKSIKAVTSCLSMTTGTSLTCPTRCTTRSGFRNGMGAIPFHPFFSYCLYLGQFWFGAREGMLWSYCVLLEGGLTAFPWVPLSLFNIWLEWCTPLPCDPNHGIWNIARSWSLWCLEHHPVYWSAPAYFPFSESQHLLWL